jgi:hypothetical protein
MVRLLLLCFECEVPSLDRRAGAGAVSWSCVRGPLCVPPPIVRTFGSLTPILCLPFRVVRQPNNNNNNNNISPRRNQVKLVTFAVLVAAASAFAPAPFGARTSSSPMTRLFSDVGIYDGKVWDNDGT